MVIQLGQAKETQHFKQKMQVSSASKGKKYRNYHQEKAHVRLIMMPVLNKTTDYYYSSFLLPLQLLFHFCGKGFRFWRHTQSSVLVG